VTALGVGDRAEVRARAEHAALAVQHGDALALVIFEVQEGVAQLSRHRAVDRVAPLWAAHQDRRDRAVDFCADVWIHGCAGKREEPRARPNHARERASTAARSATPPHAISSAKGCGDDVTRPLSGSPR
jgi:hypothetical protein